MPFILKIRTNFCDFLSPFYLTDQSQIINNIADINDERKQNICEEVVQVCPIYEDDLRDVHILAEEYDVGEEMHSNISITEGLYNLAMTSFTQPIKHFLTSIPAIRCTVQVTVVSQNNDDISDAFANLNLTDEVSADRDFSSRDFSGRIFSDRFPFTGAGSSSDDYSNSSSSDAGPSNDDYFNSGNVADYTPNDNPGNTDDGPFVVNTYTTADFLIYLLNESDLYPMIVFYPNDFSTYYPVYSLDHKTLVE